MADRGLTRALESIRRALPPSASDGQLLARFVSGGDEEAFAALVRRHGAMVLGVARRILGHDQDAEDAFQATFLVLARKAGSVVKRESVASWLHGVACRTAMEARAANARRRARERRLDAAPPPTVRPPEPQDWRPLLDRELSRLSEKYRAAVVLCDLEGRPRKEAARQLGVPEGTLSSRLAAARRTLAVRLARRGVVVSGGAVTACLSAEAARAAPAMACSTVRGAASAGAAVLARGVLRTMTMAKMKAAALVLALTAMVGAGGVLYRGAGGPAAQAADPSPSPSDADALRKENELLKLNLQVVLEKLRAQQAEKPADAKADGDEAAGRFAAVAARFKYKVDFEIGETYVKDDSRIQILEVWGTRSPEDRGRRPVHRPRQIRHAVPRPGRTLLQRDGDRDRPRLGRLGAGNGLPAHDRAEGPGGVHAPARHGRAGVVPPDAGR